MMGGLNSNFRSVIVMPDIVESYFKTANNEKILNGNNT